MINHFGLGNALMFGFALGFVRPAIQQDVPKYIPPFFFLKGSHFTPRLWFLANLSRWAFCTCLTVCRFKLFCRRCEKLRVGLPFPFERFIFPPIQVDMGF